MTDDAVSSASVLIVDDTIENLRLLSNMLAEHDYEARPVTSGEQALRAAVQSPPDLILLDISMPGMNGFEVCQQLKADERTKDVPVIFLTAYSDMKHKIQAFEMGGVDYITKPFQIEEVLARVRTHIALRQAQMELKHSYDRLRTLENLRDDLVHMIVHDMGSPLTALRLRLDILKRSSHGLDAESLEDLDESHESVLALSRMTHDLIDVSRLEQGQMPLTLALHDLSELAREVATLMAPLDREKSIEVESSVTVDANCDRAIVRRIIENLVSNSIKHTPSGSSVEISLGRADGFVRVTVRDAGKGIPDEAREMIFEKFGTVEARHERRYHSAGLGLAFCKLAVEAHGGRIGVDSNDGSSNQFWFELPD